MKKISIIVAMGNNGVIGLENSLPWPRIPADMKHFRKHTLDKAIIMGRRTAVSLGTPLERRKNIVICGGKNLVGTGCGSFVHCGDKKIALELANNYPADEIMIIGGAQIFKLFLPEVSCLYVTYIQEDFEGDTYFPDISSKDWRRVSFCEETSGGYDLIFVEYSKKT